MTIEELKKELEDAAGIIQGWKIHNDDINDLHLAISDALYGMIDAIVKYLEENK